MRVKTAVSWALGAQYAAFVAQFAASIYLARHFITPADLGLFSAATATTAIITSFQDFGLTRHLVGLTRLRRRDLSGALALSLMLAGLAALICYFIAWPLGQLLNMPAIATYISILGTASLFTPMTLAPLVLLQRKMNFKAIAAVETGCLLVNIATSILLAHQEWGAGALVSGLFCQQLSRMLIAQSVTGGVWISPRWSFAQRKIIRYGQATTLMNALWMASDRLPSLIIGHQLGQIAVGLFARAEGLTVTLRTLLSNAAGGALYAALAQARARGAPLPPLYERIVSGYCALSWPALASVAILAEPIVFLLFGDQWRAAAPVLRWLALSQMFFVSLPLHVELPLLLGQTRPIVWRSLLDSALSIALIGLGAWFSVTAAAAMRLLFGFIWFGIHAPQLSRIAGLSWSCLSKIYLHAFVLSLAAISPAALSLVLDVNLDGSGQLASVTLLGFFCWLIAAFALSHPAAGIIRQIASHAKLTVSNRAV